MIDKLSQSQETRKTQMTKQCIIRNWFLDTDKKHTVGEKKRKKIANVDIKPQV